MRILIQKFGGTSVSTFENRERVVKKIIDKFSKGYNVVVVVSAMGRKGEPYATDSLISLVNRQNISKRDLDLLMACGEIISAIVLSDHINRRGYKSVVLTGQQAGILTDSNYGEANVISVNPERIMKHLSHNEIVIVAGFQGANENGEITTLGRGGSDTTAVILGEALKSEVVEIYTDVDGIMTADPRIVPEAKLIEKICYSEVYQLAENGAKVIHPKAVEIAERANLKVVIKNTLNECDGTLITYTEGYNHSIDKNRDNIITAITHKGERVQIIIYSNGNEKKMQELINKIAENNISLDLINLLLDRKIFTIDKNDLFKLKRILDESNIKYDLIDNCCKLSIIGNRMRGVPGVMAKIVNALSNEGINILQTSDSHTTIWCLIKEKDAHKAIKVLHKEFNLDKE
ncbi:aspartate kinase [Caloranaerobacter azorensis]|uniref:Aspartokinase n=3 Tax=Caloranaerobacter azorensis TaxID=116090 RepID=A0A1M5UW72_9FIRM|nr:aspartate kinase [Caloranaerobacter azorensis]KGG80284.1 aspartate kinase [Caloranaerobacter azorensis H53214]QIB26139.1 aspartate kinase [Caloranaerobacter azorensis]SHH67241.1 aspartate kinase [Caloranaerobacter azorensis DSM 13643]